jgi:hypothetical protein
LGRRSRVTSQVLYFPDRLSGKPSPFLALQSVGTLTRMGEWTFTDGDRVCPEGSRWAPWTRLAIRPSWPESTRKSSIILGRLLISQEDNFGGKTTQKDDKRKGENASIELGRRVRSIRHNNTDRSSHSSQCRLDVRPRNRLPKVLIGDDSIPQHIGAREMCDSVLPPVHCPHLLTIGC